MQYHSFIRRYKIFMRIQTKRIDQFVVHHTDILGKVGYRLKVI